MVNRLVSVNEDNQLPAEVQAVLVGGVQTYFQAMSTQAATSAAAASSAASSAATDASDADAARIAAEAAAAQAQAPTEAIVQEIVDESLMGKMDVAPTPIPAGDHTLNDYTTPGAYSQSSGAQATLTRNYPVSSSGVLEVNGASPQTFQTYTTLRSSHEVPSRTFKRNYYGPIGWTPWAEETNSANRSVMEPLVSSEHFITGTYSGIRTYVETWGRFAPKLLTKFVANDDANTGTSLKPSRLDLISIPGLRAPAHLRSNSSGWRVMGSSGTTSANENEIIGLQIRDGSLIHDFDNIGNAALGFRSSGEARIYRSSSWTGAQVVADGVVDSFCFGPVMVENEVKQVYASTERAGRTLLGQRSTGAVILVHIFGVTGSSGATFQECADLMKALNCANAVALDGGGSSQLMINDIRYHPSSDAGEMRPLPDSLVINARVARTPDTGWTTLPLASGITANESIRLPQYRRVNGEIQLRGRVFGTFTGGSYISVGNLPDYFKSSRGGTSGGIGSGGVSGIVTVSPNTLNVQVFSSSTVSWFDLTDFRYTQAQS